jgi:hypothetical protein
MIRACVPSRLTGTEGLGRRGSETSEERALSHGGVLRVVREEGAHT